MTDDPTPGATAAAVPRYGFLAYRVRDVMSAPVTVNQETPIRDVEQMFEDHGFNAFPVVDDAGELVGLVTSLDLLRAFAFNVETLLPRYSEAMLRPVRDVMSRQLGSVRPGASLTRVLELMIASRNKSFPVLDSGRLIGMIAREDVLRALRRADANLPPDDRTGA